MPKATPRRAFHVDPLENWNDLRVHLAWAYEGRPQNAHWVIPVTMISAWLIRRGHVDLTFDGKKKRYKAGSWVFPRMEKGRQDFSDDAAILSVRFNAQWPTGDYLFDRSRTIAFPVDEAPRLARIGERLVRFVARTFPGTTVYLPLVNAADPDHYFEMQRLLYGWIAEYTSAMKRQGLRPNTIGHLDSRVRHAIHLMESQPLSRPLRERDVAAESGLSVAQLNRLFATSLGYSPAEYREQRRIETARQALLESDRSVKSIAYDIGFSSLPHFSAWARKKLGASPRELRQRGKQGNPGKDTI